MDNRHTYDDIKLFHLIATGDHSAFHVFLEKYQRAIFSQAMAYLKDAFKAQDLVQDVFLSLWKARDNLSNVENPRNYLFIITRNRIVLELKKKFPVSVPERVEQVEMPIEPAFLRQIESKDFLALVRQAIEQLPPQRKMVFELGKIEGLSYEEVAQQMNISPNTVKVHMVQALAFVRNFIRNKVVLLLFSLFSIFFQND